MKLQDIDFKNKRALVRVDFNVPLNEDLEVVDASRIEGAKSSILEILNAGGSVVLMSHLGRPKAQEEKFSLRNIGKTVSDILGVSVKFAENCVGDKTLKLAKELQPGEVLLLENLRFHPEEEKGDEIFAKKLAELGDVYVNDAFGTAHRAHASTTIAARYFREKCFGNLLSREIECLNKVLKHSEKPVTAVLGGAKVSTKITIIENILPKIDHLIIGGGMTFTFIKAQGGKVGNSLVEENNLELALDILAKAKKMNVAIHLPIDAVIADDFSAEANIKISPIDQIPDAWMGLDVGPESSKIFHEIVLKSKTILWNGPLGVFEMQAFSKGTHSMGKSIAEATENGAFSLVGGGDSVSAVKKFGLAEKVSYVSTGGGAMLEMLEGKSLPGISAIAKN